MDTKNVFTKRGLAFLFIFTGLALVAQQVNFSPLVGANNQFFTLFQFFGPIAGAFLGPVFGIVVILTAEIANVFITGSSFTLLNVLRLTPMLFATWYFGSRNKFNNSIFVPLIAILVFVLNPVGRQVWYFSLYWLIPVIVKILPGKLSGVLFFRSLGATFAGHAVGGAFWVWTVPMTAAQWIGLIPVVAYERLLFALGITVSYVAINIVLDKLGTKLTTGVVDVNKRYTWSKDLFKIGT